MCCMLLLIGIQLLFACPENNVEVWLAFLFLSREKCHPKQILVLSSSMKLGPGSEVKDSHKEANIITIARNPRGERQTMEVSIYL